MKLEGIDVKPFKIMGWMLLDFPFCYTGGIFAFLPFRLHAKYICINSKCWRLGHSSVVTPNGALLYCWRLESQQINYLRYCVHFMFNFSF
jgi:hypothetical protein